MGGLWATGSQCTDAAPRACDGACMKPSAPFRACAAVAARRRLGLPLLLLLRLLLLRLLLLLLLLSSSLCSLLCLYVRMVLQSVRLEISLAVDGVTIHAPHLGITAGRMTHHSVKHRIGRGQATLFPLHTRTTAEAQEKEPRC
jgi:hypothetical protein